MDEIFQLSENESLLSVQKESTWLIRVGASLRVHQENA